MKSAVFTTVYRACTKVLGTIFFCFLVPSFGWSACDHGRCPHRMSSKEKEVLSRDRNDICCENNRDNDLPRIDLGLLRRTEVQSHNPKRRNATDGRHCGLRRRCARFSLHREALGHKVLLLLLRLLHMLLFLAVQRYLLYICRGVRFEV